MCTGMDACYFLKDDINGYCSNISIAKIQTIFKCYVLVKCFIKTAKIVFFNFRNLGSLYEFDKMWDWSENIITFLQLFIILVCLKFTAYKEKHIKNKLRTEMEYKF